MSKRDYSSRKPALLRSFDKSTAQIRPWLVSRYGQALAEQLTVESRQTYTTLVKDIPYIGERSPMLVFLLPASRYLAIYRAMRNHGIGEAEAKQAVYKMGEAGIEAVPGLGRWAIRRIWFSRLFLKLLRRGAARSQQGEYPDGFVFHFVEGAGQDFDFGIDYHECASCKFLKAQGAEELAPVVCAVDRPASELLGWGLRRSMTLAEGDERCDFRFRKGGQTDVPVPPALLSPGLE